MITLNIHEAKTHLSRYLAQLKPGETLVICRRNKPIAEIRAIPQEERTPRPFGLGRGTVEMPAEFFEPLPDDILDAFEGRQR